MKTFYFMAGLPRSGATLLSAILNQNPAVYSSPQTDLIWQMNLLYNNMLDSETYQLGQRHKGYQNVLNKLAHLFYEDIEKPIIIDKNRSWGTPTNINLARFINPNVKIILPYRPLEEVLASFIVQCQTNPRNNYIDKAVINNGYLKKFNNVNDARCEWLLNNELKFNIESLMEAFNNKLNYHLVEYDLLVSDTEKTLQSIYKFLDIDYFPHTFENIKSNEIYADDKVYGLSNLHTVRNKISKNNIDPNKYLSDYILGKCKTHLGK